MARLRLVAVIAALTFLLTGLLQGQNESRRRYIPPELQKLDLTKDQQKKLLDIREAYGKKIDDLEFKLNELKTKGQQDMEAVLTDEQKKKLKAINRDEDSEKKDPEKKP